MPLVISCNIYIQEKPTNALAMLVSILVKATNGSAMLLFIPGKPTNAIGGVDQFLPSGVIPGKY